MMQTNHLSGILSVQVFTWVPDLSSVKNSLCKHLNIVTGKSYVSDSLCKGLCEETLQIEEAEVVTGECCLEVRPQSNPQTSSTLLSSGNTLFRGQAMSAVTRKTKKRKNIKKTKKNKKNKKTLRKTKKNNKTNPSRSC